MNHVELSNLSKTYVSGLFKKSLIQALANVSLSVTPGEIFGLLGPNGAGKTTLIKILLGIVHPTSGTAMLLGEDHSSVQVRRRIGYLPENHRYPNFLSARDTLLHFGRLQGIPNAPLFQRTDSLLETVGLKDWKKVKIKRFSKGMLQRLGLAQALLSDPEILFLDEPTDGVDPVGRKEIRDILKTLRGQGKTIFLNSHMLSEVEEISDRVAILNKGEVLQIGTIKDITAQSGHEIELQEPATEELLQSLRGISSGIQVDGAKLLLTGVDKQILNAILDTIRQKGFHIESLGARKSKLEDYFIKLIKDGEAS
jgi:ABC-2 type transport system ATP-binding protein